jgi:hypothetical protein
MMEATIRENTSAALVLKIEQTYAELVWLYRSIPIAETVAPSLPNGWSIKDMVGHLSAWEWRCASLLDASHRSNTPLMAEPDVDALNHEIYQERAAWNWEQTEYDARQAHQTLLDAIHRLPTDRLNDPVVYNAIAQETWQHYSQHLAELRQWHRLQPNPAATSL